jgi:NADPH:quinone reductase
LRAIGISRYGDSSVLENWDLPVPEAGSGEAVVAVHYAGVNFMDVHTRQGKYASSTTYRVGLPVTLGMEGSGVVVDVGPDVDDLRVGDRVAWCLSWGSFAQYARVPVARLAPVPDEFDLADAATTIFQGCTAHYLVNDVARLGPGMTCLVHAASGSIGRLVVQMATARGADVLATASSDAKAEVAKSCGARLVVSYYDDDFSRRVRDATGGRGVDVTFDAVGAPTLRDSMRATATKGMVVNYGAVGGALGDLDPLELGESGSLFLTRPRLADYIATRDDLVRRSRDVFAEVQTGTLRVARGRTFSLETVREALDELEYRRQAGKSVVEIPR